MTRLLDGEQDFGDAEQAHHDGNEAEAVIEARNAEREARSPAYGIDPDHGNQKPEYCHGESGEQRTAAEAGDEAEADQHQREEFRRTELQGHLRQRRGDDDQRNGRKDSADKRADRRDAERGAAAALFGHLVPVDTGDH